MQHCKHHGGVVLRDLTCFLFTFHYLDFSSFFTFSDCSIVVYSFVVKLLRQVIAAAVTGRLTAVFTTVSTQTGPELFA